MANRKRINNDLQTFRFGLWTFLFVWKNKFFFAFEDDHGVLYLYLPTLAIITITNYFPLFDGLGYLFRSTISVLYDNMLVLIMISIISYNTWEWLGFFSSFICNKWQVSFQTCSLLLFCPIKQLTCVDRNYYIIIP